jgi:cytochrome P450/NADPH-cytochrome P450 reductase
MHPFAQQMSEVLLESGKRGNRTQIENSLRVFSEKQRQENVAKMHELCDTIVADRKKNPKPEINDLLNVMLNSKDPETGEQLSDENIRYQMTTFLVSDQ